MAGFEDGLRIGGELFDSGGGETAKGERRVGLRAMRGVAEIRRPRLLEKRRQVAVSLRRARF